MLCPRHLWSVATLTLLSFSGFICEHNCGAGAEEARPAVASVPESREGELEAVPLPKDRSEVLQDSPPLELSRFDRMPFFDNIEPDLRDEVLLCVNKELSREARSQPGVMIRELNEALLRSGVVEQEVARLLGAVLQLSPFPFREMGDHWRALSELYPENREIRQAVGAYGPNRDVLPPGGISVYFYSSAGGICEWITQLEEERQNRRDDTWMPESIYQLPVVVEIGAENFLVAEGQTDVGDKLEVRGVMTAVSSSTGRTIWEKQISEDFEALPTGIEALPTGNRRRSKSLMKLEGPDVLTGDSLCVTLNCSVAHVSDQGIPRSAAVTLKQMRSFAPVYADGQGGGKPAPLGYLVETLGLDCRPLGHPSAPYGLSGVYTESLTWKRDEVRRRAREEREEKERRKSFIGSSLQELSLAYSSTGGADVVRLSSDRPVILTVGASWCGPCQALAPAVKELENVLGLQGGDSAVLHRFSIEDDPGNYAGEIEKYPGGVLTPEQWKATGLSGVPAYIVLHRGTVSEAGILSEDKIAEFKERYAGTAR